MGNEKIRVSDLPEGMIIWKKSTILGITKSTLPEEYYDYYCRKISGNYYDFELIMEEK